MCSDTGVGNALSCLKSQQLTQKRWCTRGGFGVSEEVMCDATRKRTKLALSCPLLEPRGGILT